MEAITTIISIAASLFAGTTIFQFFSLRSMKKKLNAEANKVSAEAEQEGAKADGLRLDNINKYIDLQNELLINATKVNMEKDQFIDTLTKKIRELDESFESFKKASEYQIGVLTRKVTGLGNVVSREIVRREYAEKHICLNLECNERIPKLGEFKNEEK